MTASGTAYANVVALSDASGAIVSDPGGSALPATIIAGSAGSLGGGGQRVTSSTRNGSIRQYGSGRVRSVTGPTTVTQTTITLRRLNPADISLIGTWRDAGTLTLLRDTYGQKLYGTIFQTDVGLIPLSSDGATQYGDVSITLNVVTVPDGY